MAELLVFVDSLHFRKELHQVTHGSAVLALPCPYFNIQCVFHRVRSQSILSHMAVSFSRDSSLGLKFLGVLFPAVCVASIVLKSFCHSPRFLSSFFFCSRPFQPNREIPWKFRLELPVCFVLLVCSLCRIIGCSQV